MIKQPFSLFLTFPRIAYEAYYLHYKRSLDVYPRPEPRAVDPDLEYQMPVKVNPVQSADEGLGIGGSVGWQKEGDPVLMTTFETWLKTRAIQTGITVTVQSSDPQ